MIECKHISKIYQNGNIETVALKDISLTVKDGEFVAIMGPSGSGKSTLMHILGCLDTPTSGQYFLDKKDVSCMSDDEMADIRRRKIGFVFQSFNLLPRATVLRNVELPLIYAEKLEKERREIAIKVLESSAFPKRFWNYRPNELSGGMMQRVAIARALTNNPVIILADEPTGNLDTKTGRVVLETFQKLHIEQGRTIILITHEQYVAEHAERIIYIRDGSILDDVRVKNRRLLNHKKIRL